MDKRIRKLADEASEWCENHAQGTPVAWEWEEKFAELIKQAIYDEVKEELVDEDEIKLYPDPLHREYLRGNNGGVVDALTHIKNFGVDIDDN